MSYKHAVKFLFDTHMDSFIGECDKRMWEVAALTSLGGGNFVIVIRREKTVHDVDQSPPKLLWEDGKWVMH